MSTTEPGTIPPPSTKSNSLIPVFQRRDSEPWTSRSLGAATMVPPAASVAVPPLRRATAPVEFAVAETISSTSVFQSPHASQRPAHLGWSAPQLVHRSIVLALALTSSPARLHPGGRNNSQSACIAG